MTLLHQVDFQGRDQIQIYKTDDGKLHLKAKGCQQLQDTLTEHHQKFGHDLKSWQITQPKNHAEFLIKKLLNTIEGKSTPYSHEEICHCRMVSTQRVENAIFNGAGSIDALKRVTTASTSCGTCGPDLKKLLGFWNQ